MNRENLKKLADGLRGPLRTRFSMEVFVDGVLDQHQVSVVGNECGTAACACGHGTYLVEPKLQDETFFQYSARVFGLNIYGPGDDFNWCFGDDWAGIDNTPQGAADRIDWLLEKGLPHPDLIEGMMAGTIPLCYRTSP